MEAPAPGEGRIDAVDGVRGFALFGVAVANAVLASAPLSRMLHTPSEGVDRVAAWTLRIFVEGKSYPLLALLFGFGLFLQANASGLAPRLKVVRRLAVLAVIGAVHALLIWPGDILILYALLGLFLLLFARASEHVRETWAVSLWLIPVVLLTMMGVLFRGVASVTAGAADDPWTKELAAAAQREAARTWAYQHGTLTELLGARIDEWTELFAAGLGAAPTVFAMMLLGMIAAERRWFAEPQKHRRLLLKLTAIGWGIGLPLSIAAAAAVASLNGPTDLSGQCFAGALQALSGPVLAVGYLATLLLLGGRGAARLAPLGRLSLTTYLAQNTIFALTFTTYGAGLYGRLGVALPMALAATGYLLQVPLANAYLRHFKRGPAEHLWRTAAG